MENLRTFAGDEFLSFGRTQVLCDNNNKKSFRLKLYEPLCGVETFSFIFIRNRKSVFIHVPYIRKRKRVVVENKMVEITTLVSSPDFNNVHKLLSLATKTIEAQIKGNNSEMLALGLFYNVSRIDSKVKPPIPVTDLMRRAYDIKVPVISSRSNGSVLVPIQVKSGYSEQAKHVKRYPRIPSVVMDLEAVEGKVLPARELLSKYVNQGVVLHI